MKKKYISIGIDGCKGKWVVVCITENGFNVGKYDCIRDVCENFPDADSYIIDIPIGLPDGKFSVRPESIVKKELSKRAATIFEVPCRQAIYANNKVEARALNIKILGKSISEQSLGLCKAIRQVDEFLKQNPIWINKVNESHPKLCFKILNNNEPIINKKKTVEGQIERLNILEKYYPDSSQVVKRFLSDNLKRKKIDDVIDALCLAVVGTLIIEKGIRRIPEAPMRDMNEILMQYVVPQL